MNARTDEPPPYAAAVSASASASAEPDRATAFRAVTGNAETVNGGALLLAGYAVVLVLVIFAVARVFQRQTAVSAKLDTLEADLKRGRAAR
jgi:hypothetical protein